LKLEEYKIAVAAVQEMRQEGERLIDTGHFTVL
jgi:hypothetical protein